jgi:hypothetical protein
VPAIEGARPKIPERRGNRQARRKVPKRAIPERMTGSKGQAYRQRFPRYAFNAGVSAQHAGRGADIWRNVGVRNRNAAQTALGNGDAEAADLWQGMAEAADDAAEALEDLEHWAREVQRYYAPEQDEEEEHGDVRNEEQENGYDHGT